MQNAELIDVLYQAPTKPKNYILVSILVTIATHIGVVALIFAIKSYKQAKLGNFEEANNHAKTAKQWLIGCSIFGAIYWIGGYFLLYH